MYGMKKALFAVFLAFLVTGLAVAQGPGEPKDGPSTVTDVSWVEYQNPDKLAELIQTQERPYLLIDVRGAGEYQQDHIPSAVNVPLATVIAEGIDAGTDALVIVYCASGNRSGQAARFLKDHGYTSVVDFGAIGRWQGALVTSTAADNGG